MAQFTNLQDAQNEYNKLVREAIQLSSKLSDANSKALNQIYSQAKAANKIPQTLAEANKEVDILTGVIETLEDRIIKLADSVKNLKDKWVEALDNLKNTSREAERAKKPFSGLASIVRDIVSHRKGEDKLSSQNLTSLARQTLIEKTNLKTSQAILLLKQKKGIINAEETEALNSINDALDKSNNYFKDQIDHAKKLSKEQRNIEQGVGLTTKALKTTEGLLQKIGFTDLSSTFKDASNASETYINNVTLGGTQSANVFQKLRAPLIGIGVVFQDLGKKFVDALVDPATYFIGVVKLIGGAFSLIKNIIVGVFNLVKKIINSAIDFIKNLITEASAAYKEFAALISDEQTNISRSLGVPFRNAQKLHAEVSGMGATAASSVESFVAIQKALGNSDALSKNTLSTFIRLKEYSGLTAESLGKGYQYSKYLGQESGQFTKNLLKQIDIQKDILGVSIDERQAFEDIVSLNTLTKALLGGSEKAIVKSFMAAKKLGIELDKVLDTSKSLLDLDQSLQTEMELFLLTGKQFDFNTMRLFALTNNVNGLVQMEGQLSKLFLNDYKNSYFVRELFNRMNLDLVEIDSKRLINAKTEKDTNQELLKNAEEQRKSFTEALTNFNRYILGIRAQGGKTFFELGQKIDLFKAKILGGLSGAIGRSVDTFISKNKKAIGDLSDSILRVFNTISEKGGVLELLIKRIFEFFTGEKIDESKGIIGVLNEFFRKDGPIDKGLTDFKLMLEGKAEIPGWMQKAIDLFNSLKEIFREIFDGIILYAKTISPLKAADIEPRRNYFRSQISTTQIEIDEVTTKLKNNLKSDEKSYLQTRLDNANKRKDNFQKQLDELAQRTLDGKKEDDTAVAERLKETNKKNWETSWLGGKIDEAVGYLRDIKNVFYGVGAAAAVVGIAKLGQAFQVIRSIIPGAKLTADALRTGQTLSGVNQALRGVQTTTQLVNAGKNTQTLASLYNATKTSTTLGRSLPYVYSATSGGATGLNYVFRGAGGAAPLLNTTAPLLNTTAKGLQYSRLLYNPAAPLVSRVPLAYNALGGFVGYTQAEETGRSPLEATLLGITTGTATTGSMLSPAFNYERGSKEDKKLGFWTSVLGTGLATGTAAAPLGAGMWSWATFGGGFLAGAITAAIGEGYKLLTEDDRIKELQEKQEIEQLKLIEQEKKAQEEIKRKTINLLAEQKTALNNEFEAKRMNEKAYKQHLGDLDKIIKDLGLTIEDVKKIDTQVGYLKLGLGKEQSVRQAILDYPARDISYVPFSGENITLAQSKDVRGHFVSAPLFVYVVGGELAAQVRGRVATYTPPFSTTFQAEYTSAKSKEFYGTTADDMYSPPTSSKRIVSIGNREYNINSKDTLLAGNFSNKKTSINQVKLAPFGAFKLTDFLSKQKQKKTQNNFLPSYLQAKSIPGPAKLKPNLPYSDENNNTPLEKNTQIFNTLPSSPSTLSFQAVENCLNELNKTLKQLANSMNNPNSTPPSFVVELDGQKVGEFAVKANKNYIASQNSLNYSPYSYG